MLKLITRTSKMEPCVQQMVEHLRSYSRDKKDLNSHISAFDSHMNYVSEKLFGQKGLIQQVQDIQIEVNDYVKIRGELMTKEMFQELIANKFEEKEAE